MSQQLINRSSDLRRLKDEGYVIEVKEGHLLVYLPYVDKNRRIQQGVLVSTLDLAGDVTTTPSSHVAKFAGDYPCDRNGNEIDQIRLSSASQELFDGLTVAHEFSSKPVSGSYDDYYDKMTTYAAIISDQAEAIDPTATARPRAIVPPNDPGSVFKYVDTASSRSGIARISDKLKMDKVAIIGLGGTGSYVLDMVVKTPIKEIHIFDGDHFLQHNAFRSPGAASRDELKTMPHKVRYYLKRYASMRDGIIPHEVHIDNTNVSLLTGICFAFICIDDGAPKLPIVELLEAQDIPFVDVGMGIELVDQRLHGILRVTTSTPTMRDHVRAKQRISFAGADNNIYSQNIQIVELNALSAALAVIKWKKLAGFYGDFEREYHCTYTLDGNCILNEDLREDEVENISA